MRIPSLPRPTFFVLFIAAICCPDVSAQYDGATEVPQRFREGFRSITEKDSESLLTVLASSDFSGRGTGQEGFMKAAQWFSTQLADRGFQPAGDDGSWFQMLPFNVTQIDGEFTKLNIGKTTILPGNDFGVENYFGTFEGKLPVTFARVTKKRPEFEDGAFAGRLLVVQSANRIAANDVLIVKGRPACIIVVERDSRVRSQSVSQLTRTPSAVPLAKLGITIANKLAAGCEISADFFAEKNPENNQLMTSSSELDVHLKVEHESIDVPNVVGWYPGSDESLRDEHVCIGAHLDHLGIQQGSVYPGADDNGSGSTSILQIAGAIHTNSEKPKRSVLLMAFCAEERGLLGSKHYAANPLRPLKDMVCMLNIDMIGRNEESDKESASENENTIHLVGSRKISNQLHELTLAANQHVNFVFEYDQEGVYNRSDHASFAKKGVPITFLFGGFTPHYHKPTDTLAGINFSKIANCARLDYLTLMMAAEHGHFEKNPEENPKENPKEDTKKSQ
ncbi:MAG: M28 family peptidase [Fuerstiella sp.]|nr:M28 family peptidase [Fuerstiella sp.]